MSLFWTYLTSILLAVCGCLLMFIILLQRGRGGGLAGAFGGLGGQSAFGTKAGDMFTRITIVMAIVWVVLAAACGYAMRLEAEGRFSGAPPEQPTIIGTKQEGESKEGAAPADPFRAPEKSDAGIKSPEKTEDKAGESAGETKTSDGAASEESKAPAAKEPEAKSGEASEAKPAADAPEQKPAEEKDAATKDAEK